ncbi:glycosyltransferase [Psychrosphaera sp. B3R10]|nr:glycosyltransferase [Psychrosphaera sp. I2R16]MBU2987973.1 glycosyltransferase [Psychrosphaera sp. B3R10]
MNEQIKMKKQKTILMVVFEFPPSNGASVPRIESFYRYLKQWGWNVVVLTATDRAYSKIDRTYTDAADDNIYRANAYDVQRDLSYKGKYLSIMETPDRWGLTWIPAALKTGKKLLKKYQPDVIWSSSPIPSTHYIANKLAASNKTPWVADYRDPCHYMNGSAGKWLDYIHKKIDTKVMTNAAQITFATSAVRDLYQTEYGELVSLKNTVIENGYDEANFEKLAGMPDKSTPFSADKFTLYYSGVLYPNGRDPEPIFEALSAIKADGLITADNFELIFQGAGDGNDFAQKLSQLGIDDLVRFIEPVPFINALNNMTQANALLLIQDARFNKQIPGKVYEYLRTQRAMLVKADDAGATYNLSKQFDGVYLGQTKDNLTVAIVDLLQVNGGKDITSFDRDLSLYSRKQKAEQLDVILTNLI